MILLDTNVVSELMRQRPDDQVMNWLRQQSAEQIYMTALTVAESAFCSTTITIRVMK